jgi:diphthamide synthase (EF-2-diphthine--ammonia ligase)
MKHLIACCGLDCEFCDARVATVNNDNELREKTAKMWSEMYNAPHIVTDSINCMGCRADGVKFDYCNFCEIRTCANKKGFNTCGECSELDTCQTLAPVLQHVPEVKKNLTAN